MTTVATILLWIGISGLAIMTLLGYAARRKVAGAHFFSPTWRARWFPAYLPFLAMLVVAIFLLAAA